MARRQYLAVGRGWSTGRCVERRRVLAVVKHGPAEAGNGRSTTSCHAALAGERDRGQNDGDRPAGGRGAQGAPCRTFADHAGASILKAHACVLARVRRSAKPAARQLGSAACGCRVRCTMLEQQLSAIPGRDGGAVCRKRSLQRPGCTLST